MIFFLNTFLFTAVYRICCTLLCKLSRALRSDLNFFIILDYIELISCTSIAHIL